MKLALLVAAIVAMPQAWANDAEDIAKRPNIEQQSSDQANAKFKALDRNHDRHISREDARTDSVLEKRFASIDSNGDGVLDQAEFQAKPSAKEEQ
jgi:Ca2+-binding EF-hand superfamily protein